MVIEMSKTTQQYKLEHSPTLNTVLMVEDTLKNMNESVITIAHLKKILPKHHYLTLKIIIINCSSFSTLS